MRAPPTTATLRTARFAAAAAVVAGAVVLTAVAGLPQNPPSTRPARIRSALFARGSHERANPLPRSDAQQRPGECFRGQKLLVRLTDELARAKRQQPDLRKAYIRAYAHWRKHPDPYSGLSGKLALGRLQVGFARGDVLAYMQGAPPRSGRRRAGALKAVIEDRLSLFLPAPSTQTYRLTLPEGGRYELTAETGVIPHVAVGDTTITVTARPAGGQPEVLLEEKLTNRQRGVWRPFRVDLTRFAGKTLDLVVETAGPDLAPVLLARPEIWRLNDCRPGPNIVLLLVDTLRADAVRAISGRWNVTPTLDRVASRGTLFRQCFAAATRTRPSMTALLASEWVYRLGLSVGRDRMSRRAKWMVYRLLAPRLATLKLRQAGYHTAAIGNNFFFVGHTSVGLDRGLEEITDIRHPTVDSPAITWAVEQFLDRNRHRPFFLWVHLDGPHAPYLPPRGYSVAGARAPGAPRDPAWERYLGEVRWADEHVMKILRAIEARGLAGNTLVALTSDHGEVFSDAHNYWLSHHYTRHHHGWSAYEEVLHVPLILMGPGVPRGHSVNVPVSHLDLLPTLFELAGLRPLSLAAGRSLAPVLRGGREGKGHREQEEPLKARPVIAQARLQVAVRSGRFKYIRRWDIATRLRKTRPVPGSDPLAHPQPGTLPRVVNHELYDLQDDPLETRNLYRSRPYVAERMKTIVREFLGGKAKTADFERRFFSRFPLGDVIHVRLWGGRNGAQEHRLTVSLEAGAEFVLVSLTGPRSQARWPAPGARKLELTLRARPGEMAAGAVGLPVGPARISIELNGRPVNPGNILAGPFGLSLLRRLDVLDSEQLGLLSTRRTPELLMTNDPTYSLWAVRSGAQTAAAPIMLPDQPPAAAEREVDRLLRAWGYSHENKPKVGRDPRTNNLNAPRGRP